MPSPASSYPRSRRCSISTTENPERNGLLLNWRHPSAADEGRSGERLSAEKPLERHARGLRALSLGLKRCAQLLEPRIERQLAAPDDHSAHGCGHARLRLLAGQGQRERPLAELHLDALQAPAPGQQPRWLTTDPRLRGKGRAQL